MKKIDDFLVDRVFEPFSHWSERRFGKDAFFYVDLLLQVVVLSNIISAFVSPSH